MIGATPRIRAIIALVYWSKGSKKLTSTLNSFLNRTHALADKRNRIVHDPLYWDWTVVGTTAAAQFRVTTKGKPDFGFRPITAEYADGVVQEIEQHTVRFRQIQKMLYEELGSSPKKSLSRRP
jgi:hypothetical protein